MSEIEDSSWRGKPVVGLKDEVKEYMHERNDRGGVFKQARKECMNRERWRLFSPWGMFLEGMRRQIL